MKKLVSMMLVLTMGFCVVPNLGFAQKKMVLKKEANTPRGMAPDFNLCTLDGKKVTLSEFKGKVVIIDFWATWCGPCRMEIPGFIELYKKYNKSGVVIIGISLDDSKEKLAAFIKKEKINYPIVLGTKEVVDAYGGIPGIPTTFIIDKKGELKKKHVGYSSAETFEKEVLKLLK